jgi:hypothetical protein
MVGALVGSTQREPLVVGKPSTFMMDYLANEYTFFLFSCFIFFMHDTVNDVVLHEKRIK